MELTMATLKRNAPRALARAPRVVTAIIKTQVKRTGCPFNAFLEIIQRARTLSAPLSVSAKSRTKMMISCPTVGLPRVV